MRGQCIGLRAIKLAFSVFALTVVCVGRDAVAAEELERTRVAEQLITASLDAGRSRKTFASAIFDYCTQTSNHLPRNTQKEDEQLTAEITSADFGRMTRAAETIQFSRYQLQKVLTDCAQVSRTILELTNPGTAAEAAMWVRLEGTLDFDAEFFGALVGVFRKDEKSNTLSDLHGLNFWSAVRTAIRTAAILPLLETRKK